MEFYLTGGQLRQVQVHPRLTRAWGEGRGKEERDIEICRKRTEQMEDTEERKLSRIIKTQNIMCFPIQKIYKALSLEAMCWEHTSSSFKKLKIK